jgi:nitrate/nitrite transport system substrate-binding protein
MSAFRNPFDSNAKLGQGCGCSRHVSAADHDADFARSSDIEALGSRAVENAVMRALFPHDATR